MPCFLRGLLAVGVLGLCVALVPSCVGSRACTSANCLGCCTADGVCASGVTNDTCGYGAAMCAACGSGQTCSNGVCGAGGGSGGSGGGTALETRMRMFVTSSAYKGDFGGVAGADQLCNTAAQAGNKGGTWKAWMSSDTENAVDRMADVGPWFQETASNTWVKTFNNKANLVTSPLATLYVDEQGRGSTLDPTSYFWTGTLATGLRATNTCTGWTSASSVQTGAYGPSASSWSTNTTGSSCNSALSLVCFEQSKLPAPRVVSSIKKRMFVTSTAYKGDFGAVAGADALCNTAAQAATKGGTWKAWISSDSANAIDRIADVGPWYQETMAGAFVKTFNNRANFAVSPLASIYVDEQGRGSRLDPTTYYWTGTQASGLKAANTCTNWTSASSVQTGAYGPSATSWSTNTTGSSCNSALSLVCFEQ